MNCPSLPRIKSSAASSELDAVRGFCKVFGESLSLFIVRLETQLVMIQVLPRLGPSRTFAEALGATPGRWRASL